MTKLSDFGNRSSKGVLAFPDSKTIEIQASEWLGKLDTESPREEDIAGFREWIKRDPRHKQAFEELYEVWEEMNLLAKAVLPSEFENHEYVAENSGKTHVNRWRLASMTALCASVLVACVYLFGLGLWDNNITYETAVGEQKTLELPDHTIVFLNTDSEIKVEYDNEVRRVHLLKGEAHFDVFHNPEKPFEVFAGNRLVRALGTAFNVQISEVEVEVIVTEGTVEIDSSESLVVGVSVVTKKQGNSGEPPSQVVSNVRVTAGNSAKYNAEQLDQIKLMVANQVEEKLSWRQGMLVFSGESLEEVVSEVSRYTTLEIFIPEEETRKIKIGGFFKLGDMQSLFEALEDGFNIKAVYKNKDTIYLVDKDKTS